MSPRPKGRSGAFAVLDIGSAKIVCFIARSDASGNLRILGIGHHVSHGVRAGIITDIKAAENAILSAVNAAEKMAGETIEHVMINISGNSLASHNLSVDTLIAGNEVTRRDIQQVVGESFRHYNMNDRQVIHAIPLEYTLDGASGIKDPCGMFGETLQTRLHMVTTSNIALKNITNCLARCRLDVEEYIASPYASGLATLTEDEKHIGCAVVDIGGSTTSIGVFAGGNLIYADAIGIGGSHITRDIARGLSTSLAYAERVKTLHGTTMGSSGDDREILDVPLTSEDDTDGQSEIQPVPKSALVGIIKPRVEEILEMVKQNLEKSGTDSVIGRRIVLTGGASQLNGLKDFASYMLSKQARLSRPVHIEGLAESTRGPTFSTAIGMLFYVQRKEELAPFLPSSSAPLFSQPILQKLFRWLQ